MPIDTPPSPYLVVFGDEKINLFFRDDLDTLLMRDREINFNPCRDIKELECLLSNDPIPIPMESEDSISSLDPSCDSSFIAVTNTLIDIDSDFGLDSEIVTPLPFIKKTNIRLNEVERFDPFFSLTYSSTNTTNPSYCFIHQTPCPKKEEYDIWAMTMEHYLSHTDYPIWQVIQNGNGPVFVTTDTNGMIKFLPPKTAKEVMARERERKARTTLLMALPKDHLAKFHKMVDAKEMWEAIKSRFSGNDESKKMQKYLLKKQFEVFSVSTSEGLHKGYDRSLPSSWSQVALIMRTKPRLDTLSFDYIYNNLRVFERNVKGTTASSSNTQNVAFVSVDNTSSTNDVSTAYSVSSPPVSKLQKEGSLSHTDERTGRKLQFDTKDPVGFNKTKVKCFNCHKMRHFARDCRAKGNQDSKGRDAGYNGNKTRDNGRRPAYQDDSKALVTIDGEDIDYRLLNTQMSANDKFGLGYGDYRHGSILSYENEVLHSVFMNKGSDLEDTPVNDRYADEMHAVPPPMTGNYMPSAPDVEIDYSKFTYGPKQTSVDESDSKPSEYASCELTLV
nr:ribonuclease H-like domain-containing protein [Tanacetum cinerariifolium]